MKIVNDTLMISTAFEVTAGSCIAVYSTAGNGNAIYPVGPCSDSRTEPWILISISPSFLHLKILAIIAGDTKKLRFPFLIRIFPLQS